MVRPFKAMKEFITNLNVGMIGASMVGMAKSGFSIAASYR
jgi:hypothetical protein